MLSGSAYRASVPAPAGTFELRTGQPRIYIKTAESGAQRAHAFCPVCGSPVYSAAITDPETYSLRIGCLAERTKLPPRRQIWCRSTLGWPMHLDAMDKVERQ
jgi:hypothetical protein